MAIRNVYLDCEFLPANPTIDGLVSIGLTDDRGAEYYAVNADMDYPSVRWTPWMRKNVWPYLPRTPMLVLDREHVDVKPAWWIRDDIADYFATTDAEVTHLWAYYGGQDICRLHSLWDNDWSDMPDQIPRWFNELETLRWQAGNPALPVQETGAHNALEDARHNRTIHQFLTSLTTKEK